MGTFVFLALKCKGRAEFDSRCPLQQTDGLKAGGYVAAETLLKVICMQSFVKKVNRGVAVAMIRQIAVNKDRASKIPY